jgi:hypothetical protein
MQPEKKSRAEIAGVMLDIQQEAGNGIHNQAPSQCILRGRCEFQKGCNEMETKLKNNR